jgi:hypothetical protein
MIASILVNKILEDELDWTPEKGDPDDSDSLSIWDYKKELKKLGFTAHPVTKGAWTKDLRVSDWHSIDYLTNTITVWEMDNPELAILQITLYTSGQYGAGFRWNYYPLEYGEMLRKIRVLIASLSGLKACEIHHYINKLSGEPA